MFFSTDCTCRQQAFPPPRPGPPQVLQYANVETFIVFRSSTPLLVSVLDYLFLNRELPSWRSFACLLALLLGAAGYVATDAGFRIEAYAWLGVWYSFFLFDAVYIKHVCDTVRGAPGAFLHAPLPCTDAGWTGSMLILGKRLEYVHNLSMQRPPVEGSAVLQCVVSRRHRCRQTTHSTQLSPPYRRRSP